MLHYFGVILRTHVVEISCRVGKSRIRADKNGNAAPFQYFVNDRERVLRTKGAVHSQNIGAESAEGQRHCRSAAPGECAHVLLKGHRADHREVGVLPGGEEGGFYFHEIGHCFDRDEVCVLSGNHDFPEHVVSLVHRHISGRAQHSSQGAYVKSHQDVGALGGFPGNFDSLLNDLLNGVFAVLEFVTVCAESVSVDSLGAGVDVILVN